MTDIKLSDINVGLEAKITENVQKETTITETTNESDYINQSNGIKAGVYRINNNVKTDDSVISGPGLNGDGGFNSGSSIHICGCCSTRLSNIFQRHWKITVGCLAVLSLTLFIVIIVLISILPRSSDSNNDQHKAICNYEVCLNNGTCQVTHDSFRCQCVSGYHGRLCEIDQCSNLFCHNGGTCVRSENSTCSCSHGYSGELCEVTPCSNVTCFHGGVCAVHNQWFVCDCPEGTSGEFCEKTACTKSDFRCLNGGHCLFRSDLSTCACPKQYYGEACEQFCQYGAQFYGCTFEENDNEFCFLMDDTTDNFNWKRHNGSTPTFNTGPSSSYNGDWYMYMEASPPVQDNHVARLISKSPLSTCLRCLKFKYHMSGLAVGTLNIYFGSLKLWTKSGNHGDKWHSASFEINGEVNKRLIFEAIRGEGITGDIAIDDVEFSPGGCS